MRGRILPTALEVYVEATDLFREIQLPRQVWQGAPILLQPSWPSWFNEQLQVHQSASQRFFTVGDRLIRVLSIAEP